MDAVPLSYPHWATTVMPIPSVMYSQTHLYTVLVKQCQGCEPTNNLHCVCVCVCVWMWFPIVGWLCRSEVSIKQRWINSSSLFGPLRWQHTIHRAKAHTLSVQHTHTPTHSRTQITCLLSAFSYRLCNDGLFSPQLNTTLGFKDIPLTVCQLWFSLPQTCVHARTQTHRAGGLLALQRGKILAKKKVVALTLWCLRIKVLV